MTTGLPSKSYATTVPMPGTVIDPYEFQTYAVIPTYTSSEQPKIVSGPPNGVTIVVIIIVISILFFYVVVPIAIFIIFWTIVFFIVRWLIRKFRKSKKI